MSQMNTVHTEKQKGTNSKKQKRSLFPGSAIDPNKSLYTPEDLAHVDAKEECGSAGSFPYTRGVHETMYRGRLWTMRQFSGFGTAHETNERFRYLLDHGQTGLSVAFDMPTLMGYDSDHARSLGEVGREGVAVCTINNMETLFDGIDLGKVSTSMTINCSAAILLALYVVVAEQQSVPLKNLRGTLQNDMLKEYIAQKEWIFPPRPSVDLITDTMEFCTEHMPQWNTISISGYHIREAGSTSVQELAFTLADGFTYVEEGLRRGLDVDAFAPRLSFFFNAHMNFFEEIAKYRAARRIWAKRMKNVYGAKDPKSWKLRFHTQTAGCSLTAQQPENNIVRTTVEALAAVLGGTQSLHTNSMDEALALPTEHAVKVALRTQQILAHETGIPDHVDPLGGSYFIESLTNTMEERAEQYFKEIDELGGVIKAIECGFMQKEIARSAYDFQQAIERNEYIMVGVNDFVEDDEKAFPILKVEEESERLQVESVRQLKESRDNVKVKSCLELLMTAAKDKKNIMPSMIEAVRNKVTLGEICEALKSEYGEWREPPTYW